MLRYLRAFFRALILSFRGEDARHYALRTIQPVLSTWCDETVRHVDALTQAAKDTNFDAEQLLVRADGRDYAMSVILKTVRFHAEKEYPILIGGGDTYRWMTLQATNLNDKYLVSKLNLLLPAALQSSAEKLAAHLDKLPANEQ